MRKFPDAELIAHVEQTRRDEWDAMQPDLERFRASDEELRMKLQEDASYLACVKQSKFMQPEMAKLLLWGEEIAMQAREGVRFEFWRYPHIYQK